MGEGSIDSNWWYGVAGPALMELVGFGALSFVSWTGILDKPTDPTDPTALLGLGFALLALLAAFLIPLFAYSAYRDAKAVREGAVEWDPNPRFWGLVALVVPLVGILSSVSLVWLVAVPYLYKRFSTRAVAVAPESPDSASTDSSQWGDDAPPEGAAGSDLDARTVGDRFDESRTGDRTNGTRARTVGSDREPRAGEPARETSTAESVRETRPSDADESANMDDSKWWYGVAAGVFCGGAFLATLVGLFAWILLATQGEGLETLFQGGYKIATLFAVGGAFAWLLTTPVFAVSMVADSRHLRANDCGWQPDSIWHLVAVGHVAGIAFPLISFVTLPAGGIYLKRRRERVGRP